MENIQHLASPWWVNVAVLVPLASYLLWRRKTLSLSRWTLLCTAIFGIAFGINEAVVVVYLRAATGLLPGFQHGLLVSPESLGVYEQVQLLNALPLTVIAVEMLRETATLVILVALSLAIAPRVYEQWALFLWMFAFWDIFYYVGLWFLVRWPSSLLTPDVLFLVPVPWFSQVWFPLLVSLLVIGAVVLTRSNKKPAT